MQVDIWHVACSYKDKVTPAMAAATKGQAEVLRFYFNHGAASTLTQPDVDGRTPAFAAAKNHHIDCLKVIYECMGVVPLMNPCPDMVRYLHTRIQLLLLIIVFVATKS